MIGGQKVHEQEKCDGNDEKNQIIWKGYSR